MGFTYKLTFLFFMAAFVGAVDKEKPDFAGIFKQKGLDNFLKEGVSLLQKQLYQIQLPEFSGSQKFGFLGSAKYKLYSLALKKVELPNYQVSPLPNSGLKLSISGVLIDVDGRWEVRFGFIHEDGTFNIKVKGLSISVGLILGKDGSGKPTISLSECSAHISNVEVHMSGTIGWLVELFHNKVESELKTLLENKICPEITQAINTQLLPLLQNLPGGIF
ncbi:lipopolysaccharide-binding protein-like [Xenopus laevis]|uniref:Bactericidal permeability-increasing protein n=1 Tax=Xenopus laevis TaxID=8355 RepID=A0A8J1LWH5_XENLA|nr:lipopolysaccharide-binding protein-like [Xenopus laevis]OCT57736.1 hypothetical protein XELAEV_18003072mg [Xenopus laevis]